MRIIPVAILLGSLMPCASTGTAAEAAPPLNQLQTDFRKLDFGMFIHYNMATYHGAQWVKGYPCPSTLKCSKPYLPHAPQWMPRRKKKGTSKN